MRWEVLLLILGMMLVTYIPRALPLVILKDKELPSFFVLWLRFIPVAILAALLGPSLLNLNGTWVFSWQNPFVLAAIPTLIVAIKSRSLMLTTFSGMAVAALLNYLA